MSDADTRQIDRAARAGDPEAEARALRERLRRGEVTREQVALLAWCGDEAGGALCDPPHHDTVWSCRSCRSPLTHLTGRGSCPACLDDEAWACGLAPLLVAALDRDALVRVMRESDRADNSCPMRTDSPGSVGGVSAWLDVDASRLGPGHRPVVLAAVRREVWGG